jgi:hypothetical protein
MVSPLYDDRQSGGASPVGTQLAPIMDPVLDSQLDANPNRAKAAPPGDGTTGAGADVDKSPTVIKLGDLNEKLLDQLRILRVEVQRLQKLFAYIGAGKVALADFVAYVKPAVHRIDVLVNTINHSERQILDLAEQVASDPMRYVGSSRVPNMGRVARALARDARASSENADTVSAIWTIWQQMKINPVLVNPEQPGEAQSQQQRLAALDENCREIILQIGLLTIPGRLNRWLANARTGYYVPFNAVFKDEVPNDEDRAVVLSYITWSPRVIKNGLVNPANGLIYRYSDNPRLLYGSLVGLLAVLLLATLLIGELGGVGSPLADSWPAHAQDATLSLIGWTATLLGVIVHMGVGYAKRAQSDTDRPPVIAPGEILPWINALFGPLVLKIFMTLVGFIGLALATGPSGATGIGFWANAFLVGYSLDSVVEVFGASLSQRAAGQVNALKKQLGVNSES